MNILLISDLHTQSKALDYLTSWLESHPKPDLVIAAGDMTDRNDQARPYLKALLDLIINRHGLDFYAVHGNNDPAETVELLDLMGRSLHLRNVKIGDLELSGIGGWGDLAEGIVAPEGFHIEGTILVTHVPPKYQPSVKYHNLPILHVSGHVHVENSYAEKIGGVKHIQLGALKDGHLALLKFPELTVEFYNLAKGL